VWAAGVDIELSTTSQSTQDFHRQHLAKPSRLLTILQYQILRRNATSQGAAFTIFPTKRLKIPKLLFKKIFLGDNFDQLLFPFTKHFL
jgi:hypothetical protein